MSVCENLQPPLPENPTLLETLTRNQIKHVKSFDSFAELFDDLPFKESPSLSLSSSSPHLCSLSFSETNHTTLTLTQTQTHKQNNEHASNTAPPHGNSDSLHLCTEGLGFESSDDVEDSKKGECWESVREKEGGKEESLGLEDGEGRRRSSRVKGVEYPPPIPCIGRSGKPSVSFMSYRDNGRFVLKEVWSPNQEFLHAHREDGRLKLRFVQPEDGEFSDEQEQDDHGEEEDCYDVEGEEKDQSVTNQVNEEKRDSCYN